jgi:KaiC/GvpD/RAD55 family RecA-like ATPase
MKVKTGITGLDAMLEGGFPEKRILLVRGGPGSGKTVFSIQFILEGLRRGEPCMYVTLEEPLELIKMNVRSFGWDLNSFEKKGILQLIDGSQFAYKQPYDRSRDRNNMLMMTRVTDHIKEVTKKYKIQRLVVDPLTSAVIHQRYPTDKRMEIMELFKTVRELGCTSVITSEASSQGEGDFYVEEYLADGVILLSKTLEEFKIIKTIRIEKMRGIKHDDQPRRFEIEENGFIVYNTEPAKV